MPIKETIKETIRGIPRQLKDLISPSEPVTSKTLAHQPAQFRVTGPLEKKVRDLVLRCQKEASEDKKGYTKIWGKMDRMFVGDQNIAYNDFNASWESIQPTAEEPIFQSNYLRATVGYVVSMLMGPMIEVGFRPRSVGPNAAAKARTAQRILDIIRRHIGEQALKVSEMYNLALYGNSFRYAYFSTDPKYGFFNQPIITQQPQKLNPDIHQCPNCSYNEPVPPIESGLLPTDGAEPTCPMCQAPLQFKESPAVMVPTQTGEDRLPFGREQTEIVRPTEIHVLSTCANLSVAPYLIRDRRVYHDSLQALHPEHRLTDDTHSVGKTRSQLSQAKYAQLIQAWIRPEMYHDQIDMLQMWPRGLYAEVSGSSTLLAKEQSIDDCWTHFGLIPVPGKFWFDGLFDLTSKQEQLNMVESYIVQNMMYRDSPPTLYDGNMINPQIVVNKPGNWVPVMTATGKKLSDAVFTIPPNPLPAEVYAFRQQIREDIEYISGAFRAAIGESPPRVRAFAQLQMLNERARARFVPTQMLYSEPYITWAYQMVRLARENWVAPRIEALKGQYDHYDVEKFQGGDIDLEEFEIIAEAGSGRPSTRSEEQFAIQTGIGWRVINPADPKQAKIILETLGQDKFLTEAYNLDSKTQYQEIAFMVNTGQAPPVNIWADNHMVHADVTRLWLLSDEGQKSPQEIRLLALDHLKGHIDGEKMKQYYLSMPPPGAPGPPGPGGEGPPQPNANPGPPGGNL